jgi:hypothetical protein
VFVSGRAHTEPGGEFVRNLAVVGAPAHIAELASYALPFGPVCCVCAGDCVCDLVQQDLVNLVVIKLRGEIA